MRRTCALLAAFFRVWFRRHVTGRWAFRVCRSEKCPPTPRPCSCTHQKGADKPPHAAAHGSIYWHGSCIQHSGRWAFHVCRVENFAPGSITRARAPTKRAPSVRITKAHCIKVTKTYRKTKLKRWPFPLLFHYKNAKMEDVCGAVAEGASV